MFIFAGPLPGPKFWHRMKDIQEALFGIFAPVLSILLIYPVQCIVQRIP
jgi:hypothetical protein